jgi:hypothetical protein
VRLRARHPRPHTHVKGEIGPSSRGGWLGPFSVIPQVSSVLGPSRPLRQVSWCPTLSNSAGQRARAGPPGGMGVDGDRDADQHSPVRRERRGRSTDRTRSYVYVRTATLGEHNPPITPSRMYDESFPARGCSDFQGRRYES